MTVNARIRTGGKRTHIDSLTGLRFFAALWVLLMHFSEYRVGVFWKVPGIGRVIAHGGVGVDLFFVLSGFILSHVYHGVFCEAVTGQEFARFLRFRFARLYPVHLATTAVMLVLAATSWLALGVPPEHLERYSPASILATLTMTHAWFPGVYAANMPSWSISAELFAYLLFPFLMWGMVRGRFMPLLYGLGGFLWLLFWQAPGSHEVAQALPRITGSFLIGMAAFAWCAAARSGSERLGLDRFGGLLTVVAILLLCGQVAAGVLSVLFALLIVLLTNARDLLGHALSRPLPVYLGEVSYALYMVHWPVRAVLRTLFERMELVDWLHPAAIVLAYVVISLVAAMLLYHLVEIPGRRLIRTRVGRRREKNVPVL